MKLDFLKKVFGKIKAAYLSVSFVFAIDKPYIYGVFFHELMNALKTLPYMFLTKNAVSLLSQNASLKKYFLNMFLNLVVILFFEIVIAALTRFREKEKECLNFRIKELIIEKNTETDYYTLSTKEHFLRKGKAMEAYQQGCIDKNISLLFSTISNIILLLGIIITIATLGLVIILPILITVIVRILSEYLDRKAYYIRTTQLTEVKRKSNYLHQICENIRFAKEIRIFNLKDKFNQKLDDVSEEQTIIWKKYMRVFRQSSTIYDIADIWLQLLIYLILAYRIMVLKTLSIADFTYIFAACQQIQNVVGNVALNSMNIFLNANYLDDFMKYWNDEEGIVKTNSTCRKAVLNDCKDMVIEFKNVSFQYPNTDRLALNLL